MNTISLTRTFTYARDALSGLGILYLMHLLGIANLTIQAMEVSPAQARYIQNSSEYAVETVTPKSRGGR